MPKKLSRRKFLAATAAMQLRAKRNVYVVPNFHPASCGWLTNFSMERVYCANSYFDHLDRVRDDANYRFALSECNNMIAMLNFRPERKTELLQAIRAGRVELVNAFFLESTVNLSGGEALVRLGVEGMRWQQKVLGVRPRYAWCIDVCGTPAQLAQITAGLGLDACVYTRGNNTKSAIHWLEAPDGSKVLAIAPGHYSDLGDIFRAEGPLTPQQVATLRKQIDDRTSITPAGAPVLAIGGYGDYNLAPKRKDYPTAFTREWGEIDPSTNIRFTTLSEYVDEVKPKLASGAIQIPTMKGGTNFFFLSFWIQNPRVKMAFRRSEHQLQAAEMLAAAASLRAGAGYPAQDLYHAWLQVFLNMDRNTLWGAAGGMVFEHETSWDASDRFRGIDAISRRTLDAAGQAVAGKGSGVALFSPLNWKRSDPVTLAAADVPAGVKAESLPGGRALCRVALAPASMASFRRSSTKPVEPTAVALPGTIENAFYTAKVDASTGALVSLKLKPSGREVLGGAANILVAERPKKQSGDPGDHMLLRPERDRLGTSSDGGVRVSALRGPLALTVIAEGKFHGGGDCRRVARFYHDSPRIDFETTLNDVPDRTVVVAEFPLADEIADIRRAVPYGFDHKKSGTDGIAPAVRWSDYSMANGAGLAILDRGLSGREVTARTPVVFLLNTTNKYYGYPNSWLSGEGRHHLEYAVVAHEGAWSEARIPQMAWEYNTPLYAVGNAGSAKSGPPLVETSGNVIVESLRRDGGFVEVRLVECFGEAGKAHVALGLPHQSASLTDMTGAHPQPLAKGPRYEFAVRPQQIVTLRFSTASKVAEPEPLLAWDPLAPEAKRPMLHRYSSEKGHPPRGV